MSSRAVLRELTLDGEEWMVLAYAPPRPAVLAMLTAAEMEVTDRWLAGRSMRSIAKERGVAARTIANQLASVYEKLGVSSRAELVTLVHDLSSSRADR